MKISTKGRYGLRALVDMAVCGNGGPVSLSGVVTRQKLSLNYMEQVFGILRKAGIVNSVKGPCGGYLLAKQPAEITIKEVLDALEGSFSIIDGERDIRKNDAIQAAIESLVWSQIDKQVNDFLDKRTIADLVVEYHQLRAGSKTTYCT